MFFYAFIFADFISRRLSQILSADFRGWFSFLADFFYVFILLMFILFLADGFYVFIFLRILFVADVYFISRRLSQILSADFRGWFSFLADFFYVFNLYFYEISIWIFWVIRLVDPKHGIQFFVSYVFDIMSVPNRHVYISWL